MNHRAIGDLSVSVVGLGCNNFGGRIDAEASRAVVEAALEAGIDFFDTADVYGAGRSEEYLGRALGPRRKEAVVATKFGSPGSAPEGVARGSARWIQTAVERSLERLGTDYIDLYQLHFPDPEVAIEETLEALHELVREGKVRAVGCSNFGSTRLYEAAEVAGRESYTPFCAVQNRYSVLTREPEPKVIAACEELGLALVPYFPLESGLLTGKYRAGAELPEGTRLALMPAEQRSRFLVEGVLERVESLREFAEERGHSLLELAFSWLLSRPVVGSVIAGATRPDQVAANVAAIGWRLGEEELARIDSLCAGD